ncbi:hypothetical protein LMG28138_05764 [Pararobbsia alpina]|uniref:Uncharacterized protein n=1 Tax=Pararobbsia alpina TaxID=621374 RepID=A0A6S7CCJ6_9BURK|nr:hypothetical protein LMG28138_05764 [Pararobbsia alpina]
MPLSVPHDLLQEFREIEIDEPLLVGLVPRRVVHVRDRIVRGWTTRIHREHECPLGGFRGGEHPFEVRALRRKCQRPLCLQTEKCDANKGERHLTGEITVPPCVAVSAGIFAPNEQECIERQHVYRKALVDEAGVHGHCRDEKPVCEQHRQRNERSRLPAIQTQAEHVRRCQRKQSGEDRRPFVRERRTPCRHEKHGATVNEQSRLVSQYADLIGRLSALIQDDVGHAQENETCVRYQRHCDFRQSPTPAAHEDKRCPDRVGDQKNQAMRKEQDHASEKQPATRRTAWTVSVPQSKQQVEQAERHRHHEWVETPLI